MKKYNVELTEAQIDDIWGLFSNYEYEIEQKLDRIVRPYTESDKWIREHLEYKLKYVRETLDMFHQKSKEIQGLD